VTAEEILKIQDNSVFAPAPFCVSRVDKNTGAVDVVTIGNDMKAYKIDGVSAFIWRQFDGKNSVGDILDSVVEEYDVSAKRAKQDIKELIGRLFVAELLQMRE
jgi:methyltransferase-like protein